MARVLAISSHVARGNVGLALTVPALQRFGHEVWAVPTVLLASRPGLGHLAKYDVPAAEFTKMLGALAADGCWPSLGAVLTGYFPSPQLVEVAVRAVADIRAANPNVEVLVDPILGDNGRLYVAEETAAAIRDKLLPLATIATPNLFELQWLTGATLSDPDSTSAAARALGPPAVLVTSASQANDRVTTLLMTKQRIIERWLPARRDVPNGAGDLFAGLLLGQLLASGKAGSIASALSAALADLDPVLAASQGEPVMHLSALAPEQTARSE